MKRLEMDLGLGLVLISGAKKPALHFTKIFLDEMLSCGIHVWWQNPENYNGLAGDLGDDLSYFDVGPIHQKSRNELLWLSKVMLFSCRLGDLDFITIIF